MNGMLLAAGRGERMEPLSSLVAKPALDVLGRPLLASALEALSRAGCRTVVVNVHRHPGQVEAAARTAAAALEPRLAVTISPEPVLLGSGGGIAHARPLLGPGAVLVGNGDVLADLDLGPLLEGTGDDEARLGVVPHPDPARWSSVELDGDRVVAIHRPGVPPDRPYLFTGFQLLGAGVVAALPPPPGEMAPVWEALRRAGRLRASVLPGTWREAGSPEAYRALVVATLAGASWRHGGAEVAAGAVLERSAVGAGCRIGAGARLSETVCTLGGVVSAGCVLERCVLAGATVESGARLVDALVLPAGRFPLERTR